MFGVRPLRTRPLRFAVLALLAALSATAAARPAAAQTSLPTGFSDLLVAGALNFPIGMAFVDGRRLLVIEQKSNQIRLLVDGALSATDPVGTVDGVQNTGAERGLLGIAVDPGWPGRPYVYVHCDNLASPANTIRISRYTVTGDLSFAGNGALSIDVGSRRDLINTLPDSETNHNGGTLRFGPDGKLYDSMGEDGQSCLAQDDSTLHGVILRLEVNNLPSGGGPPPSLDVITPSDNPQVGATNLNRRLIYAYGLRNPYRFHIDPTNGDLFIADVGESQYEEIDRASTGGLNFGWPNFEGPAVLAPSCVATGAVAPIFYYDRSGVTAAVMSAGIYRAPLVTTSVFPVGYQGDYFFSDYYAGFLRRIELNGGTWSLATPAPGQPNATDWGTGFLGVSDYLVGPDGGLWYVRQFAGAVPQNGTGQIRRIVYNGTNPPPPPPPGGGGVTFAEPYPSPAPGYANLSYTLDADAVVRLVIYDLNGRVVRHIEDGTLKTAGTYQPTWDGTDDDGRNVRAGLYAIRLQAGGVEKLRRVMLIR
jgi:glucose/arabinose dehydrogenase